MKIWKFLDPFFMISDSSQRSNLTHQLFGWAPSKIIQLKFGEVPFPLVAIPGFFNVQEKKKKSIKMFTDERKAECLVNWFLTALQSHQEALLNLCHLIAGFVFFHLPGHSMILPLLL